MVLRPKTVAMGLGFRQREFLQKMAVAFTGNGDAVSFSRSVIERLDGQKLFLLVRSQILLHGESVRDGHPGRSKV